MNEISRPRPEGAGEMPARQERERPGEKFRTLVADGPWSDHVKEFADRWITTAYSPKDLPVTNEAMAERLSFLDSSVSPAVFEQMKTFEKKVLTSEHGRKLRKLLQSRLTLLRPVLEAVGAETWNEMLLDQESFKLLDSLESSSSLKSPDALPKGSDMDAFLVEGSDVTEAERLNLEEVNAVLAESGMLPVIRRIAKNITVEASKKPDRTSGAYSNWHAVMTIRPSLENRHMIPAVILHETGHGANVLLATLPNGQELFDRYAVSAVLRPETASWYAESYIKSEEAQPGRVSGRSSMTFLSESFAEDFRAYWIDQDRVLPERRKVLDEMSDALFPELDRDEVRVKIRRLLKDSYHVGPDQVIDSADCERAEASADKRIEETRKRAQEFAARQEAKKAA